MNSQFSERRRGSFSHLLEDHSGPHAGGVKVGLRYHLTSNASARGCMNLKVIYHKVKCKNTSYEVLAGSSAEVKGYYCQTLKLLIWRFAVRIVKRPQSFQIILRL